MRSAPIGLAAESRQAAFDLAKAAAVFTNGHPSGYLSAAYFASVIFDVARHVRLPVAMGLADAMVERERGSDEVRAAVQKARITCRPRSVPR